MISISETKLFLYIHYPVTCIGFYCYYSRKAQDPKKSLYILHKYVQTRNTLAWTKKFAPFVVSGSSHVVAHMMVTGGLHNR
jgi:hypothetical protein